MKVFITLDTYRDVSQWRYLDKIVNKVADGWHIWQIEDPDSIEKSGWVEGAGREWIRELFKKAAIASSYPPNDSFPYYRVFVSLQEKRTTELTPEKAAKFLSMPLTILMENRFTDGKIFLNEVLNILGHDKMNEQRLVAPDSICYDSQGGIGELPKLVSDYADRAYADGIPIRVVVFTDSDSDIPGEIKHNVRLVQQACEDKGIVCWTLFKRTIENYIPDEVLDLWNPYPDSDKGKCISAIKRLNKEQRNHYPMKKGFDIARANSSVQALYRGIRDEDMVALSKGLGKDVIKKLQEFRDSLSVEALQKRDGEGELDDLVKKIADAL